MTGQTFVDAQAAFPFVISQGRTVETFVYTRRYPEYNYAGVIPVVTQGAPWAIGTQFMTMDMAGEAKFLSGAGTDMPFNQATRDIATHDFAMLGSGWEWNIEEVNQASLYGIPLNTIKAASATRSIERKLYDIAMVGAAEKGWTGFVNSPLVTVIPASGTTTARLWVNKTPAQILADLNALITSVSRSTGEVEWINTVSLPPVLFDLIATIYVGTEGTSPTVLERFRTSNAYTSASNQPITINRVRALATAGSDGGGRIVAYRNEEEVVRFHLPMPRNVLPTRQKSIMGYETGIIARTGGTEWRLPGAAAYMDFASAAP